MKLGSECTFIYDGSFGGFSSRQRVHHSQWSVDDYRDMTITSLAEHAVRKSDYRFLLSGFAGQVPVDVLVEGRAAERTARRILQRLLGTLPNSSILDDDAMLSVSRALDDLIAGIARETIPFLSVSVGRQLSANSGSRRGVSVAHEADPAHPAGAADPAHCAGYGGALPSVVLVAKGEHIVGVATAVAAPNGPGSLIAATVSSARTGLSTVLARHVMVLGSRSAEPLLRLSDASGIAVAANGDYLPL